jgi:hypothetical protein
MRNPRKYLILLLAGWMLLVIPLVTGIHHHTVYTPLADREMVTFPSGIGHDGPDYQMCDICARLAMPAEAINTSTYIILSIITTNRYNNNRILHLSNLLSQVWGRAPPSLVV